MQGFRTATIKPAACAHYATGRTDGNETDHRTGEEIWTVRIQKDNGHAAK